MIRDFLFNENFHLTFGFCDAKKTTMISLNFLHSLYIW